MDAAFSSTGFTPVSDNEHIIYLNPELQARFFWVFWLLAVCLVEGRLHPA